jgi:hypothetical protein
MDGVGGRRGWEWCIVFYCYPIQSAQYFLRIFILEGVITVAVSLIAYRLVPTWSHKAKFVRSSNHALLEIN